MCCQFFWFKFDCMSNKDHYDRYKNVKDFLAKPCSPKKLVKPFINIFGQCKCYIIARANVQLFKFMNLLAQNDYKIDIWKKLRNKVYPKKILNTKYL